MTKPNLQAAARWYVYALIDPRDGAPFYVGKGCGNRIHHHERDAINRVTVCSRKLKRIRDLQALGLEVEKRFEAFFWDEQAAYDHETDWIEEIGLQNLTNVLRGGQRAWECRRQERDSRRLKPLHVALGEKSALHLMQRAAEWLKFGGHEGRKVSITTSDPYWKLTCDISEAFYNEIMPSMWKRIRADSLALEVFKRGVRPYGVEVI